MAGFVTGVSDAYRFERRARDGGVLIVVRDDWDPVPVGVEEGKAARTRITTWARGIQSDWTWNLPPIPEHKPAFRGFVPSRRGTIWVLRPGAGYRVLGCEEDHVRNPCWRESFSYDLFDSGGRFLSNVSAPDGLVAYLMPYIDGDVFVAILEDESGTRYVKRFRLELTRAPEAWRPGK